MLKLKNSLLMFGVCSEADSGLTNVADQGLRHGPTDCATQTRRGTLFSQRQPHLSESLLLALYILSSAVASVCCLR